jgi:hypothetical protein
VKVVVIAPQTIVPSATTNARPSSAGPAKRSGRSGQPRAPPATSARNQGIAAAAYQAFVVENPQAALD